MSISSDPYRPSISIILTVYNGASTLRQSLDSLLNQTYPIHQIIVIDDGSTDTSAEIAQSVAAEHLQVQVVTIANSGRAHARNVGLELATGELVTFAEDDAIYTPQYLEKAIPHFANPQVAGVIGPHYVWNHDQNLITRFKEMERRRNFYNYEPKTCWFYRREQLVALGGYDERIELAEDVVPGFTLTQQGYQMIFEPEAIWLHREPSDFWSYLRRKFRGGLSIGLLGKSGWQQYWRSMLPRLVFYGLGGLLVTAGGIWAINQFKQYWVGAAILAVIILGLVLARLSGIRKTRRASHESLPMIIAGVLFEYIWWAATLSGILYSMLLTPEQIRRKLRGR
jgi:glycosyltransferase involved in cell wall biosynthesis